MDDITPPSGSSDGWKPAEPKPTNNTPPPTETTDNKADQSATANQATTKTNRKWWHIISYKHTHLSKPKWALLVLSILIAITAGAWGCLTVWRHSQRRPADTTPVYKNVVKPKTEPSRLTGLQVDPELNKRPVTGVMIENSPDARPQAGLRDAGVVFEAIAEGGITRFLALFQDTKPNYIGPVRSVRPYYVDWALSFNASIAHVGGSPDGLSHLRNVRARDLDEFANPGAYWRISTRYAPHNVYTNTGRLDALNKQKGYNSSTFTSWPRKTDEPAKQVTARTIDLSVSSYLYSPHYVYDNKLDRYLRSEGGQSHRDEKTGRQLAPKVVIALVTHYGLAADGHHSVYSTVGSGRAYIFQDGLVTIGIWRKASERAQLTFISSTGKSIKLNAGQTWITALDSPSAVSYKP